MFYQITSYWSHFVRHAVMSLLVLVVGLTATVSLLVLSSTPVHAATASTINFQARLENATGSIAADGDYNVEFKLYKSLAAGASAQGVCVGGVTDDCQWMETRTGANKAHVTNGYLTVNLGSVTAFGGTINWNQQLYITMNIGGAGAPSWDGEMSPRLSMTAVPYAFQAGGLGATNGTNIATLNFTAPTAARAILLPDASGTVCLQAASTCGFITGSGAAFVQGGNSFGAQAVIGSNDANNLAFRTNSSNRLVLDTSGNLQLQQASTLNVTSATTGTQLAIQGGAATLGTNVGGNLLLQGGAGASTGASGSVIVKANINNSLSAFQVQNASAAALLTADTSNMRLGVNVTYTSMTIPSGLSATAASGGSLTAGSYKYEVTAVDSAGGETSISNEFTGTTAGANLTLNLSWTASTGASGYKIYRTAAAGASGTEVYLTSVTTNSYSDTGVLVLGTATPSVINTAYVSANVVNSSLQLSLGGNGTPTGQLYVSGTVPASAVGRIGTGSGPTSIYTQSRYSYVVNQYSNTLQIFDVSNPATPIVVGSVATTPFPISVYVQGRYAYIVGTNNFLQIIDISAPATPTVVSTVATANVPEVVKVQGRYAYVLNNSTQSLQIFDVSNPATPIVVGSVATGTGPPSLFVQGRYAYSVGQGSNTLQIFDVSNPATPIVVGSVSTGASSPQSVYVQGRYAYVASQNNTLQIFDVSNPASPKVVGSVATGNSPLGLSVQGRYAYEVTGLGNTLQIFDVSNPASPKVVGSVATGNGPTDLSVQGRYAYVLNQTDNTLQIFDVGGAYIQQLEAGGIETGTLQTRGNTTINGDASITGGLQVGSSVQVSGDFGSSGSATFVNQANSTTAFRVQNANNSTILAVDTVNIRVSVGSIGTATGQLYVSGTLPTSPIGTQNTGTGPQAIYVQGRYVYIINNTSNTFQIFDASNPASISLMSTSSTGNAPSSVYVQGRYAYVANTTSSSLQVFDISNPKIPTIAGTVTTGGFPTGLYVSGRYAFLNGGNSLQMYDTSVPTNPSLVSSVAMTGGVSTTILQGKYLYATNASGNTFQIFDISNPASLANVGTVSTGASTSPDGVAVQGRYAYVTNQTTGTLQTFDISDPTSPTSLGTVATGTNCRTPIIQGRYLYLANYGSNTFQIFDISNPATPTTIGVVSMPSNPISLTVSGRYVFVTEASGVLAIFDIGGIYTQQLEAGGIETGTLQTRGNATINGDLAIQGGVTTGGTLNVSGGIATNGQLVVNVAAAYSGNLVDLKVNGSSKFKVDQSGNIYSNGANQVPYFQSNAANGGGRLEESSIYISNLAGNSTSGGIVVTFPTAFGNTPVVFVSVEDASSASSTLSCFATNRTSTGFVIYCYNNNATISSFSVQWLAYGP